jgi:Uma2 family endonuclease
MSTATLPPPARPSEPAGRSVLLSGIRWDTYESLLCDLRDRPTRLTYDRGELEIMAPSFNHERCKRQLGRVVETVADETGQRYISGGSTTFRRADLERGLEPDDCFYLVNVQWVLGKSEIDLRTDPPPDLALEIDITASSLDRLAIYAALGIPEVWRFDGSNLQVLCLSAAGEYQAAATSRAFPALDLKALESFLVDHLGADDGTFVSELRAWLRGA